MYKVAHLKSAVLFTLIAVMIIPSFNSCQKGEGDPFFSFLTRKQRLARDWTFTSMNYSYDYNGSYSELWIDAGFSSNYTSNYEESGEQMLDDTSYSYTRSSTRSYVDSWDGAYSTQWEYTERGTASMSISFKKDGTFTQSIEYDVSRASSDFQSPWDTSTTLFSFVEHIERTGTWSFLGGESDEYKAKERLYLSFLSVDNTSSYDHTTFDQEDESELTYDEGTYTQTWTLEKLTKDEIVMHRGLSLAEDYRRDDYYDNGAVRNYGQDHTDDGVVTVNMKSN